MKSLLSLALALLAFTPLAAAPKSEAPDMDSAAVRLLGRQLVRDVTSEKARKTVRGTHSLWVDVVVQKPEESSAFANLEQDLKLTDLEGTLRNEGFKVMDPKKKSLAVGLRPTLVLMVLRSPAGAEGVSQGFYLVVASAVQDVTPLGGSTFSTVTWAKYAQPVLFSGDEHKDVDNIRIAAREAVKAFVNAAQDNVTDSGTTK
jgi:hypothetical protein